jgi:hypothetical protein
MLVTFLLLNGHFFMLGTWDSWSSSCLGVCSLHLWMQQDRFRHGIREPKEQQMNDLTDGYCYNSYLLNFFRVLLRTADCYTYSLLNTPAVVCLCINDGLLILTLCGSPVWLDTRLNVLFLVEVVKCFIYTLSHCRSSQMFLFRLEHKLLDELWTSLLPDATMWSCCPAFEARLGKLW